MLFISSNSSVRDLTSMNSFMVENPNPNGAKSYLILSMICLCSRESIHNLVQTYFNYALIGVGEVIMSTKVKQLFFLLLHYLIRNM